MKEEIWRPVIGYEGLYEVSTLGRVKSLKNNKGKSRELILKGVANKQGYLSVTLYKHGKNKILKISRLVALSFIPNPDNLAHVDHINNIKTDNSVDNLQWLSALDNQLKAIKDGLCKASQYKREITKETHQIISTWINERNGLQFVGNSCELARAFPEHNLSIGRLSVLRSGKINNYKNWIVI